MIERSVSSRWPVARIGSAIVAMDCAFDRAARPSPAARRVSGTLKPSRKMKPCVVSDLIWDRCAPGPALSDPGSSAGMTEGLPPAEQGVRIELRPVLPPARPRGRRLDFEMEVRTLGRGVPGEPH